MGDQFGSRIAADLQGWDAIDDHRTGTPGDRQTSEWLAGCVRAAGVEARVDDFALSRWVLGRCAVEVGGVVADGVPLFDGGTTGPAGIAGRLGLLTNGVDGVGVRVGLGDFGNAAGTDANRRLADARRSMDHAALVMVSRMDANVRGLALRNADSFTTPFGAPVLQVATDDGAWLRAAAGRRETARVTVEVSHEPAMGSNVVARIDGVDPTLAPLVVLTPKSAWWVCTAERGGGIATWLALLRHFAVATPPRTVFLVATSGHELGHLGLEAILASGAAPRGARAWIHLGANFAARGGQARLQASDADLFGTIQSAMAGVGVSGSTLTPPGQRPVGEARNIHELGERYVSILGSNPWFHHPEDRWPSTIDLDRTNRIAQAVLAVMDRLV